MKNTITGVMETISKRIAEVAHPSELKAASPLHQKYFLLMWGEPNARKRINLVKEMKSKLREEAGNRIRTKLNN